MHRSYQRLSHEVRPTRVTYNVFDYADGSVLLEIGKTRVICGVTLSSGVPHFLKGKQQGWLTASYSLLPTSTKNRIERESAAKRNERSVEISRLIGRSLRTIIKFSVLGERTINVDCDVLQADGGTRAACITAASIALRIAQDRWLSGHVIKEPVMSDEIAALSVGVQNGTCLVDLDFAEDSQVAADFNFVFTKSGKIIEIQGTAEREPLSWHEIERMRELAWQGTQTLFESCKPSVSSAPSAETLGQKILEHNF
ncbi:MAG TPA: ribonuclease PH [Candidatus Babeliales bacterium]|nr:ribonuclease PH [Candidatus Babeliales bacterium]